ncbi:hypothetical protein ACS0TY_000213 [Phlomoides rotata]
MQECSHFSTSRALHEHKYESCNAKFGTEEAQPILRASCVKMLEPGLCPTALNPELIPKLYTNRIGLGVRIQSYVPYLLLIKKLCRFTLSQSF